MKKYKEAILVFIFFLIATSAVILTRNLNNLDEIWVFNTARNIANGLLPYKDFNLITTPGLPILCGVILKIFGTEMFIMRIIAVIVNATIMFMIYKILKLLNINKNLSLLLSIIIMGLFIEDFCIDYNFMVLLIALITLYIELKSYFKSEDIFEYKLGKELLLGVLAGISITMKQTIGLCFVIVFIGYKLLAVRSKEEFKVFLKIAVTRLLASLIPIALLIIYLLYNGLIADFIDYAIMGIREFSNSKPYTNLLKGNLNLLAILVPIIIIISLYITLRKKDKIITILTSYSVSTIIVVYPIADDIHFLIAGTITMITGIYLLKELYKKELKESVKENNIIWAKNFINAFTLMITFILVIASIYKIVEYGLKCKNYNQLKNFKYIPISEEYEEQIVKVDEYIESQDDEIYIVDARAAIYMIPINRYNKNYDMFLKGNIGSKGSVGIIEDLQSKDKVTLLLLHDENSMNWQTPLDVIEYIKENYEKTGQIEIFDIYEKIKGE